eukprot:TRINITY_DN65323_c0_g1_i1.p1 TRINITY_DN65323_c0_g1~~TRINITY_DN65323_c0_g1_i1.p1  ORF type:complete len:546 (+),score=192.03 TRINITY_DN65323_c0_g1_i1:92-1639(+)
MAAAPELLQQFDELLPFLVHDRIDVRKLALTSMVQFCLQPAVVDHLLSERAEAVGRVVALLVPGSDLRHYSIPCLQLLINLCAHGAASRLMVEARCVQRVMLLLDKGGMTDEEKDLCLWLLMSLTSVSPDAVTSLLQRGEGLREGYYFSVLLRRFVDETLPREELVLQTSEAASPNIWRVAEVIRNCAQSPVGRRLLLDDTGSVQRAGQALCHEDERVRLAVAGLLRNMLLHRETHGALCSDSTGAAAALLARLEGVSRQAPGHERSHAVLDALVDAATCLPSSEDGVRLIDSAGGKATFQRLLALPSSPAEVRVKLEKLVAECDDVQDVVVAGPGAGQLLDPSQPARPLLPPAACVAVDAQRRELGALTAPGVVTDHERALLVAQRLTAARYRLYYETKEVYPRVYPPPAAGDGRDVFRACDEAGEGAVTRKEIAKYLMRNQTLRHRLREGWARFNANFGTEDTPENHEALGEEQFTALWQQAAALRPDAASAPPEVHADPSAVDDEARMDEIE